MTRQKDLKRLVRARMSKTGESYTAARAHLLSRSKATRPYPGASVSQPTGDYATLAGISNATIKAKTGCTWERWVPALDYFGADRMQHRDIVALVTTKYKIKGWWAQSVTVGYERIKGLRAWGQRRDGSYEANKSRTFHVPLARLYDAWADARLRTRWLDGSAGKVRSACPGKSMRFEWPDRSIALIGFLSKGPDKSVVAIQHTKLPDRASVERLKQYWSERLDALGQTIAAPPSR